MRIEVTLTDEDVEAVLEEVSGAAVAKVFDRTGDTDSLLDAIGVEKCKEYFNLVEKENEE